MAIVNNQEDEEQGRSGTQNDQQSQGTQQVASATPSTTSSSTGSSGGSKQGSPTQSYNPSAPTSSGNFTNLKSYLGANNNGQDFSNQVNNNLQQQGTDLNNNIQGASNQFNNNVQSVVNPVQQNYQAYQQVVGNNDPNSIVNYANQGNNSQNIQGLENATYTGPKTLNDLTGNSNGAALQSQVSNYKDLANNTGSEAGRMNLLQSLYGNQNYNQGQQTLDNVFLQGNNFGNTVSKANQLNNTYNTAANNAATSAQNAQNTINNAASGTANSLNSAVANEGQNFQNNYQNVLNNQNNLYNQATGSLQSGTIDQKLANELGLNNNQSIYNVDPSQFLQKVSGLNAQNTGTAQDYANIQALNNLLGSHANTAASQTLSQYANQPGQMYNQDNLLTYDKSGLSDAIAKAQNDYQSAKNPLQNQYDQSTSRVNDLSNQLSQAVANNGVVQENPFLASDIGAANANGANIQGTQLQQLEQFKGWMANQQAAQQAALENLANQYGVNKTLNIV